MNKRYARQRRPSQRRAPGRLIAEPGQGTLDMTPAELAAAGESVYGPRWRTALARDIHRSTRLISYYLRGEHRIPPAVAMQIRAIANIGPIGFIIRHAVRKIAPDLPMFRAHKIAREALKDLTAAGVIGDIAT